MVILPFLREDLTREHGGQAGRETMFNAEKRLTIRSQESLFFNKRAGSDFVSQKAVWVFLSTYQANNFQIVQY